jgi:hypothetical protein
LAVGLAKFRHNVKDMKAALRLFRLFLTGGALMFFAGCASYIEGYSKSEWEALSPAQQAEVKALRARALANSQRHADTSKDLDGQTMMQQTQKEADTNVRTMQALMDRP